jgi:hypothetical protein
MLIMITLPSQATNCGSPRSPNNMTDLQEIRKYTLDEIIEQSKDHTEEELVNPKLTEEVIEKIRVYYAEGNTALKCFTCDPYLGDDPNMKGL